MGKPEDDEFSLSSTGERRRSNSNNGDGDERGRWFCCNCFRGSRFIGLRCLVTLILGISVFGFALFSLPPFFKSQDPGDLDLDPRYRGHEIVGTFKLQKPVSFLKDNVAQLEADIYDEFEAPSAKVTVLSLESSPGSNDTLVVFGMDSESKHSKLSPTELSLIRSIFGYLVTRRTDLKLTISLFGQPSFFEVLKFTGGITVTPSEKAYPLQNVQIVFNFTLNNSILQIQENFEDLTNQLKSGLHLTTNEVLHIRLTNSRGSTVAPPATVQTSVVLAVGVPSAPRLKQLAQTIKDSPTRNLGLNNRVFGKVKQVSLSALPNPLDANSPSPAPSPLPHSHHHHHHHHHQHDHRHHQEHGAYLPPAGAPSYSPVGAPSRSTKCPPAPQKSAPPPVKSHPAVPLGAPTPSKSYYQATPPVAPAPAKSYQASPPGCRFRSKSRHIGKSPAPSPKAAAMRPATSPHYSAASPRREPKPLPPIVHQISPASRLPSVIYARVPPPSKSEDPEPPDREPSSAPSPSGAGHIQAIHWGLAVVVALLFHPW